MEEQSKFEGWAIVEMMGHQREIGYVTTEAFGVAVLFRVDTPALPEAEVILRRPQYGSDGTGGERYLPVGSKVKRQATAGRSRLVSPQALYAINPCTEEAAKEAIVASANIPLVLLQLPNTQLILMPGEGDAPERCPTCNHPADEGHDPDCPDGAEEQETDDQL